MNDYLLLMLLFIYLIGGLIICAAMLKPIAEEDRGFTRGDIVIGIVFLPHVLLFLLIAAIGWLCVVLYDNITILDNKLTKWWTTPLRKTKNNSQ